MNMKAMLPLLLLASHPAVAVAESLEGVEVIERVEAAKPGEGLREIGRNRIVIANNRVRIEKGHVAHIYDAAAARYVVLLDRTEEYFAVESDGLRGAAVVPPAGALGIGVDPETGNPVVPAHAFRLLQKSARTSTWETTAPAFDGSTARITLDESSVASWAKLESVVFDVFTSDSSPLRSLLRQTAGMRGYPSEVDANGPDGEMRTTVVSVRKVAVSNEEFTVPGTYRRIDDPNRLSGKGSH